MGCSCWLSWSLCGLNCESQLGSVSGETSRSSFSAGPSEDQPLDVTWTQIKVMPVLSHLRESTAQIAKCVFLKAKLKKKMPPTGRNHACVVLCTTRVQTACWGFSGQPRMYTGQPDWGNWGPFLGPKFQGCLCNVYAANKFSPCPRCHWKSC